MAGEVGVDPKGFLRVVRPVIAQRGAQGEHSLVLGLETLERRHVQVEVVLLGHAFPRPCRRREFVDLLEGDGGRAARIAQDEPVFAAWVGFPRGGGSSPER